jgi:hypothetical protein
MGPFGGKSFAFFLVTLKQDAYSALSYLKDRDSNKVEELFAASLPIFYSAGPDTAYAFLLNAARREITLHRLEAVLSKKGA